MLIFATLTQPKPSGDGKIVLESVKTQLSLLIELLEKAPFVASDIYSVEGLKDLYADLVARAELGKAKYGTYLRTNNGRSAIIDLYQEVTDGIMYAQQARMEGDEAAGMYVETLINIGQRLSLEIKRREF